MADQINIELPRADAWGAFIQVGGTPGMSEAGLFNTHAQAFYAGMVAGIDRAIAVRNAGMAMMDDLESCQ